ncbi:MAG: VOC family protein [Candidatus Lambdaproteobacteria bacterium]|nr:VOC family protein [Candidatus Lambdaproteobacteria bacterium]
MEQRLSLITLGTRDLARARRFYEQGLGWRPAAISQPSVAFYRLGGMALALYSRNVLATDAGLADRGGDGFGGLSLAYNVRERRQVAQVLAEAGRAGGRILKPGEDTAWGGHSGYFADPDGHVWEVAWNPAWTILPDGSIRLPDE